MMHMLLTHIRHWKLRKKLIVSFLTLVTIPTLILSVYTAFHVQQEMVERVEDSFSDSIYQVSTRISHQFERYNADLGLLVMNRQFTDIFENTSGSYYEQYLSITEVLEPILMMIQQLTPELSSVGVYTANKHLKTRDESIMDLDTLKSKAWWPQLEHRHLVQWFQDDDDMLGLSLLMRTSYQSPESYAYVRLAQSTAFALELENVASYGVQIMDGDQVIYTHHVQMEALQDPVLSEGIQWIDNQRLLIACRTIEATGWKMWVYCPYEALSIDVSDTLSSLLLLALVSTLLLSMIGLGISNSISRRIERLNAAFLDVESGHLDVSVVEESDYRDEIGDLTQHYNHMVAALNDYIRINYEDKIHLREAELKTLQAQINPHFLYNSLSLINWKALENDATEISEIVCALSDFYRSVLNHGESHMTVRMEMTNVEAYLKIQSFMHDGSFTTSFSIAPDILDCDMIGIILQPIVENAIEHGIDCRRSKEGSEIRIAGYGDENSLFFSVQDNGPGMSREQFMESITHSSKSYGLKNVQDRIRIAYGETYGLRLDENLPEGTCVIIRIPRKSSENLGINP